MHAQYLKLNEKGIASIVIILLLVLGIGLSVYLVSQKTNLFPKAFNRSPSPESSISLVADKQSIVTGQEFKVDILIRSDLEQANLFKASFSYPSSLLKLVSFNKNSQNITNWVEEYYDATGSASFVGGIPDPGLKTEFNQPPLTMATITFKAIKEGKAVLTLDEDSAVFRNSDNVNILTNKRSLEVQISSPAPNHTANDFNGDGKADIVVWQETANNLRTWFIKDQSFIQYGKTGDIPVPADYDGDGKTDIAVWQNTGTGNTFYIQKSSGGQQSAALGSPSDIPVPADYDGDGKADPAVWTPGSGIWTINSSSAAKASLIQYGKTGDIPVPADYDGDGKTDIAVWQPSGIGQYTFYIIKSSDKSQSSHIFGSQGDIPTPKDFNGDGKADIAVFRPPNGTWYIQNQPSIKFGKPSDIPVPADYDGDGKTDIAVWQIENGGLAYFRILGVGSTQWGRQNDIPLPKIISY